MGQRWIGVKEEAIYGTTPGWPAGVKFMPFVEHDLQPNQNVIKLQESLRVEDEGAIFAGFVGTGSLRCYARPDNMGHFLLWLFGSNADWQCDGEATWRHRFTVAQTVDSFSMEVYDGIAAVNPRFLEGCVVKGLTLEATRGNPGFAIWDIQYRNEDISTGVSALGTLPSIRPLVLADATVVSFGETVKAESIRVNATRAIPDDAHVSGSRLLPDVSVEGFKITGELDLRFENWTQRQAFYGLAGASTTPQEEVYDSAITISFDGPPSGDTVCDSWDLNVNLPACVIMENPHRIASRDRLMQRVIFESIYHANNRFDLYNTATSY